MSRSKPLLRKSDFLTIPDAPNYEINGYFKVRNKKTGKILSNKKRVNRNIIVTTVFANGRQIKRNVETFYRQAVDALKIKVDGNEWGRITSYGDKYEMNWNGEVRNRFTKIKLKPISTKGFKGYALAVNNQCFRVHIGKLFEEVFGRLFHKKSKPVPVTIQKANYSRYFKTMTEAIKFISSKVFYCFDYVRKKFSKREPIIFGYKVTYFGG